MPATRRFTNDATFTDALTALGSTIKEAESDGLSVMVRPLLDFVNATKSSPYSVGDWRGYYVPSDPAAFFASYKTMLAQEATVAQPDGAQMLSIGTEIRVIEADDPLLTNGFHAPEDSNGFRWTDGSAKLPMALFAGFSGVIEVVLQVGCMTRYEITLAKNAA